MLTSYKELYAVVGGAVTGSLQWDSIAPYVAGVEERHLARYIGFEMLTALRAGLDRDDEVRPLCCRVVGWFLLLEASRKTNAPLSENGHIQVLSDTFRPSYFGAITDTRLEVEREAYRSGEALLVFLSVNRLAYPIWARSEAFTRHAETLLRYAFQMQLHIGIECERVVLERLRGLIRDVESLLRLRVLPIAFFDHLRAVTETDDATDAEDEAVQAIQAVTVHLVEWEAVKRNIATNTGVAFTVQAVLGAAGDTTTHPASLPALTVAIRYQAIATSERMAVLTALLWAAVDDYPLCFHPDAGGSNPKGWRKPPHAPHGEPSEPDEPPVHPAYRHPLHLHRRSLRDDKGRRKTRAF